jgi:hypothetical protein
LADSASRCLQQCQPGHGGVGLRDRLHSGGRRLTAIGLERSLSGRTGIYDIEVRNQRGEMIALFRGKSYRIKGHVIAEGAQ